MIKKTEIVHSSFITPIVALETQKLIVELSNNDIKNIVFLQDSARVCLSNGKIHIVQKAIISHAYQIGALKFEKDYNSEQNFIIFMLELLCTTSSRDAIVGDLLEQYQEAIERFGPKKAKLLLWIRALRSIVSLTWGFGQKLMYIAAFAKAIDWLRKLSD